MANETNKVRIYMVDCTGEPTRLVEAANPAQAIRYCAMGRYKVHPARARDVAVLMANGVTVEVVAADAQSELPGIEG